MPLPLLHAKRTEPVVNLFQVDFGEMILNTAGNLCFWNSEFVVWSIFPGVGVGHKVLDEMPRVFVVDLLQVNLAEVILCTTLPGRARQCDSIIRRG